MREQEPLKASDHPPTGPGPQEGASPDAAGAQEYLTVAANSKSLRRSTTLVAVLVAIGMVCLLVMIRRSQPQAASAAPASGGDQTKIEAAISRLTGVRTEMAARTGEIVKKFYEFSDVVQVKVDELVKNPFLAENAAQNTRPSVVLDDPQAQAELLRRQQMEKQASTLKLLSIMRSAEQGNCCMINDRILRPGDMMEGFKIVQIGNDSVELAWSGTDVAAAGTAPTEEMKTVLKLSQ